MFAKYREDPASVPEDWALFFAMPGRWQAWPNIARNNFV